MEDTKVGIIVVTYSDKIIVRKGGVETHFFNPRKPVMKVTHMRWGEFSVEAEYVKIKELNLNDLVNAHLRFCDFNPFQGADPSTNQASDQGDQAGENACPIKVRSVLQDWVCRLPLREQGTLLTCIRGCDLTPKYPLDSPERRLVGAMRYVILNPADPREVDCEPGSFFVSEPPDFKPSALGHYPWHWISHVLHSIEVIGYRHPDAGVAAKWQALYGKMVNSFHLFPETKEAMIKRLSEDRIASGTVVS